MGKAEQISVELSGEFVAAMNEAVAGGDYASLDDVVLAALHDWKQKRDGDLQQLREALAEGVASGFEPHDGMASIKQDARRRLVERLP